MKVASVIARYLAGVIFLVFGLNGFLNFIPLPPPVGVAGQFMGALYISHYMWVIFAFQVIAGVLLLVNRFVPLAVAVHSYLPRLDGSWRAAAGHVRDSTVGRHLHSGETGVFSVVPATLAA